MNKPIQQRCSRRALMQSIGIAALVGPFSASRSFAQSGDAAIAARLVELGVQVPAAGPGALTTITIGRPGERMTDADMAMIGQLGALTSASFSILFQVTPAGYAHLGRMPRLERLYISSSPITADGLAAIGAAPSLRILDLSTDNRVDDAAMGAVAAMRGLTSLSIPGTRVTDAGLASLASHPALKDLRIMGLAGVTDAGLLAVARIPTLVSVNAARTGVTEAGVAAAMAVPGRNAGLRITR